MYYKLTLRVKIKFIIFLKRRRGEPEECTSQLEAGVAAVPRLVTHQNLKLFSHMSSQTFPPRNNHLFSVRRDLYPDTPGYGRGDPSSGGPYINEFLDLKKAFY